MPLIAGMLAKEALKAGIKLLLKAAFGGGIPNSAIYDWRLRNPSANYQDYVDPALPIAHTTVRQAIAPRRVMYGTARSGGIVSFITTTSGGGYGLNGALHLVVTFTTHECKELTDLWLDGAHPTLDTGGNPLSASGPGTPILSGKGAGYVLLWRNLGGRDQAAYANLITEVPSQWTTNHRQRGCASVYLRILYNSSVFPNGIPNVEITWQGVKLYDPRTGTRVWSANAALVAADYLSNSDYGLAAIKQNSSAWVVTQSGLGSFTAANVDDGDTTNTAWKTNGSAVNSYLHLDAGAAHEYLECRIWTAASGQDAVFDIQYSDNDSTWTTAYSGAKPDSSGLNKFYLAPNGAHRYWRLLLTNAPASTVAFTELEFYESLVDRTQLIAAANTCDEAVSLAAGGTEPRYTFDGVVDTAMAPGDVIRSMATAMAGQIIYSGGAWLIFPGAWRAPTVTLTDSDVRGPLTVNPRLSRRDTFNGVRGTYIAVNNKSQATDYPPVTNASYLAEDGNENLWLDLPLPYTASPTRAQRIAKIVLERARRQIVVQIPAKITAYQLRPPDVFQFNRPTRFNWSNKTFEIEECHLVAAQDGAPAVDLVAVETDANVYAWSTANEGTLNTPGTPTLPDSATVAAPSGMTLTSGSTTALTRLDGVRISRIKVSWTAPSDAFVGAGGRVVVQYKKNADSLWQAAAPIDGQTTQIFIPGVDDNVAYDVQMWAENVAGARSAIISVTNHTVGSVGFGHASYRPKSNPLTAHDAGSNATANIAAFTMAIAGLSDKSINSGSITALSYSTPYYIYYDDAGFAGGAVTFLATTTRETAFSGAGRFFVGTVITPKAGASDTIGNNDGGAGAQSVPLVGGYPLLPTTETATGTWSNAGAINDGLMGTARVHSNLVDGAPAMVASGFSSQLASRSGLVLQATTALSRNDGPDTWVLEYSTNGGTNWTTIFSVATTRAGLTDAVALSAGQDVTQVQVRFKTAASTAAHTASFTDARLIEYP